MGDSAVSALFKVGQLVDRRHMPLCDGVVRPNERYAGDKKFVFVMSTGHTATKFLADHAVWTHHFGEAVAHWDTFHEHRPGGALEHDIAVHEEFCSRAKDYVTKKKLPVMLEILERDNKTLFMDSGA